MTKKIGSIKHTDDKRAHIPSQEEAGYEVASSKVKEGKKKLELPKNPVVHRGQDPELYWMHKYGADDTDTKLNVDIRSLYRHEHVAPENLISGLHRIVEEKKNADQLDMFRANELFGNALEKDELEKVSDYYQHHDGWTNRLIQGDSLLVMSSLLEREGMAGQVQCFYFDPPYGIKYNSNWQMKLNDRNVKDGKDEHLSGEPEMIKAFRDTWELGIHSYLSYLRDRLLVAKELLTDSGSCFVQISDENVHLVRSLMDEVFGSENFVNEIIFRKTVSQTSFLLPNINDYILWYCKNKSGIKYRELYKSKSLDDSISAKFNKYEDEKGDLLNLNKVSGPIDYNKVIALDGMDSQTGNESTRFEIQLNGITDKPKGSRGWRTSKTGVENLIKLNRITTRGRKVLYKRYFNDSSFLVDNLLKTKRI
mgnify:CR=1 FL=1